jgi:hypothetical protein
MADRINPDYDRLWKLRRVFEHFTYILYSTIYRLKENLVADEVIVKYKG